MRDHQRKHQNDDLLDSSVSCSSNMSTEGPLSKVDMSSNDQRPNIDVHSHASDDFLSKRFSLIHVTLSSQMCVDVFNNGTRRREDLPLCS